MGQRLPGLPQGWAELVVAGNDKRYAGERAKNERTRQNISEIGSVIGGAISESRAQARMDRIRKEEIARQDAIRREQYARQNARYAVEDARHALSDQDRKDAAVYKILSERRASIAERAVLGDTSAIAELESVDGTIATVQDRLVTSAANYAQKTMDIGGGACADGTCSLPKRTVSSPGAPPPGANDGASFYDLTRGAKRNEGYIPPAGYEIGPYGAVPSASKAAPTGPSIVPTMGRGASSGGISVPATSPVPGAERVKTPLDRAAIEKAKAESEKARATAEVSAAAARLKQPFHSALALEQARVNYKTALAALERANVTAGLASADFDVTKKRMDEASAAEVARAKDAKDILERRMSSANEIRMRMRAYGVKPTSEQMKAMEADLANPNVVVKDPDVFIEAHFPGSKAAHDAKYAKPSADKRTPEEQAKYEADLEVARKNAGSPKASKPEKPDDTLSNAEDDADKAALALAEEDAREAYHAIEAFGDKPQTDSPEYKAAVKAHEDTTAKVRAAKQGMVSRAEFRRIEAATRSEMGDEERTMFDRLTPSQKREYVAALRERKARSR